MSNSALSSMLGNRPRVSYDVPVDYMCGEKGQSLLRMRVASKGEADRAVLSAHGYLAKKAKAAGVDPAVAVNDSDILEDAKTCHLLFEVCRDPADESRPCFPGAEWMIDKLTKDEIAVLLASYVELLRKTSPHPWELSSEKVDEMARMMVENERTDTPNLVLALYTREQISELAIRLALKANRHD